MAGLCVGAGTGAPDRQHLPPRQAFPHRGAVRASAPAVLAVSLSRLAAGVGHAPSLVCWRSAAPPRCEGQLLICTRYNVDGDSMANRPYTYKTYGLTAAIVCVGGERARRSTNSAATHLRSRLEVVTALLRLQLCWATAAACEDDYQ